MSVTTSWLLSIVIGLGALVFYLMYDEDGAGEDEC